ncbi:FAD binding domain-containing protein [Halorarum salinum]|uniref:Xanthine dehydrogenase family protein subunit M n=1 Tax=Halorarum salinum TaxID=2743089 RepID=A0A7D5L879_9EURY|nr:xanthine dehydrogenase family protein subunit M [Halobaculum salinum]QLG60311.1 xanthine dehydrogenase family protein subunit M [Halobaculum salinum]
MAFPDTVGEACRMLAENPGSQVIAGGTAITVVMKEGVFAPDLLINIRGLAENHSYVTENDKSIRIGALTPLRDVEQSRIVSEHLPVVVECLQEIAGVRVRNSATLGGHLAHADVHLDLPPVLAGYDADVIITDGEEERQVPIEEFMQGYYETDLADAELIKEIVISKPDSNTRGTYVKHRYFSEVDWPCVGVAAFAVANGDDVTNVRVLLNSVSHKPIFRLDNVNKTLNGSLSDDRIGQVAEDARRQVSPSDDLRGSAEYKERMAGVFTERALQQLQEAH